VRKKVILMAMIFLFLNATCPVKAQRQSTPSVKSERLAEGFYKYFIHDYVNMFVFFGPDGILLVDSGFEPVDIIKEEINKICKGDIKYIINTHFNGDHILGNAALSSNSVRISSEQCRVHILKRDGFPINGLPNLTFTDSMCVHFNNEEINLIYLPGHTNNDIIVYFKNLKIVCLGDLVFSDSFPGTQKKGGGNALVLEKSIGRLLKLFPDDVLFVVGHGRDLNREDLKVYHEMIHETIAIISGEVRKGEELDAIKKKKLLKRWGSWNSTFFPGEISEDTWVENIYESLVEPK